MTDNERAISIFMDEREMYIENASGGFASALTHEALLNFFGCRRVYITVKDPRKTAEEPVDVEELKKILFPEIPRSDEASHACCGIDAVMAYLKAQGYKITRSTQ